MGRLEIEIRHGRDGGGPAQWGAVVALIVLVLFAAAGHREIGAMLRDALAVVEIIAAGTAFVALAVTALVLIHRRTRRARAARREYLALRPDYRVRVEPADRPRWTLPAATRAAGRCQVTGTLPSRVTTTAATPDPAGGIP